LGTSYSLIESRRDSGCVRATAAGDLLDGARLSSPAAKNISSSRSTQIISLSHAVSSLNEGRIAIVTDVGFGMRWTRQRRRARGMQGGLSIEGTPVSIHPARGRTALLPLR
jgi:hypothetical protein